MNPDIFREYDIRGIAGKDMTEDDVIQIGKGVGTYLLQHGSSKLAVGRDCRKTSDLYAEKITEGLLSTGCDVIDIGVCPTPVFYFSISHLKLEGGVMITASHNPQKYFFKERNVSYRRSDSLLYKLENIIKDPHVRDKRLMVKKCKAAQT